MRCLPSEKRAKPAARVEPLPRRPAATATIKLAVNGKDVSGGSRVPPPQGVHLPRGRGLGVPLPQHPDPGAPRRPTRGRDEVATLDEGFVSLYSGLDLRGWRADPGHAGPLAGRRTAILDYDGKSEAKDKDLWTEKEYGDFLMVVDWRLPDKPVSRKPGR